MIKEEYKSQSDLKKEFCEKFKIDQDFKNIPYDIIQLEYERYAEYFIENGYNIYDTRYSPIKSLAFSKKGIKNDLLHISIDTRTIDRFFTEPENSITKFKTLDYLSISLGYYGWKNFRKGNTPSAISSTDDKEVGVEELIQPLRSINANIPGAIRIDEEFVWQIRTDEKVTKEEFYTGRQSGNYQWIGVLKHFDVERNIYPNLKETVAESFKNDRDFKVSAAVLGDGGCGKSTILRRLALDLHKNKSFNVLWLKRGSLKEFVEEGIKTILENSSENYLLIIEDWYRNVGNDIINAKILLEKSTEMPNFRICIGDRNNSENLYWKYLTSKENFSFILTSDENKSIIDQIIKDYPQWKNTADALLTNNSYKSSLFMLLFIIAHIHSSEDKNPSIDLSEPQAVFVNIIKSDLNKIAKSKNYKGLAQALYYTACLYKEYKVPITYEAFLKFADFFQGTSEISRYFLNRNLEGSRTVDLVQKYISLKDSPGRHFIYLSGGEEWVHFNHDIFFELGLTQILFEDWEEYGEITKAKIMSQLIEYNLWWKDYLVTDMLCNDEKLVQQNKKLFFRYINILFENYGAADRSVMNLLKLLNLSQSELLEFTKKIIESFSISPLFGDDEEQLLAQFFSHYKTTFKEIYDDLLNDCLSFYSKKGSDNKNSRRHFYLLDFLIQEQDGKQKLYHKILDHSSFPDIDGSIAYTCLKGLSDTSKASKIANSILLEQNAHLLSHYTISAALDCADYKNTEDFTVRIFRNCFRETKKETLIHLLNKVGKKEYLGPFVSRFFHKNNNPESIDLQDLYKIEPLVRQELFEISLGSPAWEQLIPEILLFAFREVNSLELKNSITKKIARNLKWMKENLNILFHFWTFSNDIKIENYILGNWMNIPVDQIFKILDNHKDKNPPTYVKMYVSEVIQNYHSTNTKIFHFGDLFLLDIQNVQEIQNETQALVINWQNYDRSIIAKLICSDYIPDASKYQICNAVLENWEYELKMIDDIDERIRQYENLFFGNHTPIAKAFSVNIIHRWINEDEAEYYSIYCKRYLFELCLFHPIMKEKTERILTLIANTIDETKISVPKSILSAIENFNDFYLNNSYWENMKDKIVNHTGYSTDKKMYKNIFG